MKMRNLARTRSDTPISHGECSGFANEIYRSARKGRARSGLSAIWRNSGRRQIKPRTLIEDVDYLPRREVRSRTMVCTNQWINPLPSLSRSLSRARATAEIEIPNLACFHQVTIPEVIVTRFTTSFLPLFWDPPFAFTTRRPHRQ